MLVFIFLASDHWFCSLHLRGSVDAVIVRFRVRVRAIVRVRVEVTLRLAVYRQLVRPGPSPLRPKTSVFQLNTCGYSPYVTSSLTRGYICRL
jgi:hypothetical protein